MIEIKFNYYNMNGKRTNWTVYCLFYLKASTPRIYCLTLPKFEKMLEPETSLRNYTFQKLSSNIFVCFSIRCLQF